MSKKLLTLVLLGGSVVVLAGCVSKPSDDTANTEAVVEETAVPVIEVATGIEATATVVTTGTEVTATAVATGTEVVSGTAN